MTLIQDLKWSLILGALGLVLGMVWQWPLIQQGFQGKLVLKLQELEKQEVSRRLEGVRTYNLAQVHEMHQKGQTLFIDARPPGEYRELHIEGTVNLTADQLDGLMVPAVLKNIDPNRSIVVYCAHEDCHASLQVAELLQSRGFLRAAVFMGGFRAWDEAGYPVDVSR